MDFKSIHNVYFIGSGGIGMSALARYFKETGKNIAGYDKTPTKITKNLSGLGVDIHYKDDVNLIDESFKNTNTTLVV